MPRRLSRLISLCFLLLALATPLLAQDAPAVTITPASGPVEQAVFDIQISGLAAESAYTVEILFDGEVVFSSEETSDADGQLSYPISSTEGDLPGVYTLQVISEGEVVASAEFELIAADETQSETAAERDLLGDVTVTPDAAPFGKVQTIRIGELESLTNYTVEITARESLQVAYRRIHASDEEGVIEIEVFAEEGDTAGRQAIAVYDQEGELIAEGEFTIEAPPERDAAVALNPAFIAAGGETEIAATGLAAFDSVTAQITSAEGILIDTILARASSDGEVALSFAAADDLAAGVYAVEIFVDGDKLTAAELTVGELEALDLSVTVDPPSGDIGTQHTIAVGGLAAEQAFALVILDPAGGEEYRSQRSADGEGEFSLTISSAEDDETGDYRVQIRHAESDDLLAEASFAVSAAEAPDVEAPEDSARITINPQAAPLGSSHLLRVSGLRPNEMVEIDVVFASASVYRTRKQADSAGRVRLELETSDEDEIGDYTITVLRGAGVQPSALLTATAKAAPAFVSTIVGDAEVIEGRLQDGSAKIDFAGEAGQVVLINVASHDFDPAVALIDRDDIEMIYSDDSRGQKDPLIGPFSLPYSGEYTLEISAAPLMMPQGAIDGEFVVTIADASLAPLAFEREVAFSLSAEAPAQYFALPVEIGDSLTVTVDSGGALDTLLQLVAPSGLEYAFDDDSGSGFDAELSNLVFDHAATYVLAVSTFDGAASGSGTVNIRRNPVQALEDGTARVTLNDKAIRDLVVFDAAEDEYLILKFQKLKGDVEDLYVTAKVEGMEVMAYSTMGVPDELPLAFVMPMSGRVVVTLEKFGYDDGIALEVSLERP